MQHTLKELYLRGKRVLHEAGAADPAFEAICLMQETFGIDRAGLALRGAEAPAPEKVEHYERLLSRRADGMPLQYLLGEWEFLSLTLTVREGVLIPRPETEQLCETAAEFLLQTGKREVLDLCAGTGAVGLGVCALVPEANVQCVEYYDAPYVCLLENIRRYPQWNVEAVRANVLAAPEGQFHPVDAVLSNPPYIASAVVPTLQREVLQEPAEALDGGADGLVFYRALARHWLPILRPDGLMAVEIGEEQGAAVALLFQNAGLKDVQVLPDASGHDRMVCGKKSSE